MNDLFMALLLVWGPTAVVCALFYWWSTASHIGWLSKLLRISSIVSVIYFFVLIILIFIAANTCSGNILKGLFDCTLFPDIISRMLLGLGYISYALAIFYALILVAAGGLVEALRPTPPR